mmetsp:Transcript_7261/g.13034  ORF Transcript_7261/g.13034 Transcript_7261/m.13034 type:complete len:94 (+) Transcript_7261:231-512(+)
MPMASVGVFPGNWDCVASVASSVSIPRPPVFLASVAVPSVKAANRSATSKDNCSVFPFKVPSRARTMYPPPLPLSDSPSIHAKTPDAVSQSKA